MLIHFDVRIKYFHVNELFWVYANISIFKICPYAFTPQKCELTTIDLRFSIITNNHYD